MYLTWARIEKSSTLASTPLSTAPIIVQYLFFLTLNASATLAHHLVVRLGASIISNRSQQATATTSSLLADGTNETPSTPTVATSFISASANVSRSPSSQDMLQGLHPSASASASAYSTGSASTGGYGPSYWPPDTASPSPQQGLQTQLRRVSTSPAQFQPLPPPSPPSANAVSTALFVSSCPKLFPILMVIWGSKEVAVPEGGSSMADSPAVTMLHKTFATVTSSLSMPSASGVLAQSEDAVTTTFSSSSSSGSTVSTSLFSLFGNPSSFLATFTSAFDMPSLMSFLSLGMASTHLVLLNNIEALYILLDCGYLRAVALAVAGQLARWLVEKLVLGLFGIY